jgi:hypothetical protein
MTHRDQIESAITEWGRDAVDARSLSDASTVH